MNGDGRYMGRMDPYWLKPWANQVQMIRGGSPQPPPEGSGDISGMGAALVGLLSKQEDKDEDEKKKRAQTFAYVPYAPQQMQQLPNVMPGVNFGAAPGQGTASFLPGINDPWHYALLRRGLLGDVI